MPGEGSKGIPASRPAVVTKAEEKEHHFLALGLVLAVLGSLALTYMYGLKSQPYITIAGLVVVFVAYRIWRRLGAGNVVRLRRAAEENGGCLCLHCGYPLKGLPTSHRCPECGILYEIEEVKRIWSAYLTGNRIPVKRFILAPPIIGRLERWQSFWSTMSIAPVVACVPLFASIGTWARTASPGLVAFALLVLTAAGMLLAACVGRRINQLSRQACAVEYVLCPDCGYCLNGLPAKHCCPECGTAYDIEDVKRIWSEYVADRADKQIPW